MKFIKTENGFTLSHKDHTILTHSTAKPAFYLGVGQANYEMYRGNFDITDYLTERLPLKQVYIEEFHNQVLLTFSLDDQPVLAARIVTTEQARLKIYFTPLDEQYNRFWLRINASKEESVYGCGEQLSHFNLRGKHFPLWSSEPGVGRNKNTFTTWQADSKDNAGGDYYNTNYPQPTFISNKKYFCHLETSAYADFDFRHADYHELQCWNIPDYLLVDAEDSFVKLMTNITDVFGRQPALPEWVYNGVILGIQGGTQVTLDKIEAAKQAGIELAGVWCQDWQGVKMTSFGKRLQWDWQWDSALYPELNQKIHALKEQGVRFLGYINPYVLADFPLFNEAREQGYLATKADGTTYLVDFGEFYCGVVDFTNPQACDWYKGVIRQNLIDFGLDGWMGDFGEYLPTDCQLANGVSAEIEHNKWPYRWAKVQHEAIEEAGKTDDILCFMRAGGTGIQGYCHALWAGDQSVIWELDDGLASVIPAALSAGLMGNGISHSDIGGYTTLHGNTRSKELLLRWAEMAAFTPIMRTHEGNRPADNHQYDSDQETMAHIARMSQIYKHLKPYIKAAVIENAERGIPVQRPLFMHYEQDSEAYQQQYQYLFGQDLLVAPVYNQGETRKEVYLPEDEWVHVWSGEHYQGGWVTVDAPIGQPAVFYRKDAQDAELLAAINQF